MSEQGQEEVNFAEVERFTLCSEECLPPLPHMFFYSLPQWGATNLPDEGLRTLEFEVGNNLGQRGKITFRLMKEGSGHVYVTACTKDGEPFLLPTPAQYAAVRYDRDPLEESEK